MAPPRFSQIRNRVTVRGAPADVWPYVADPAVLTRWMPGLLAVRRTGRGPIQPGETFDADVQDRGRARVERVTAVECLPPSHVVYRHESSWPDANRRAVVVVTYELRAWGRGTRVTQWVDLSGAGLPGRLLTAVWLIMRFGMRSGPGPLDRLAALVGRRHCPSCGYDVRATPDRCPECGTRVANR